MELADKGQLMEYDWDQNNYFRNKDVCDFILGIIEKAKDIKGKNESFRSIVNFQGLSEIQRIELIAKWAFYQILHAVEYLHINNIVHRDIKIDNILISSSRKVMYYFVLNTN